MHFLTGSGHTRKTSENQDIARANLRTSRLLRESRMEATEAYAQTLDVTDIVEFTDFLRDPVHGGVNFDLKGFLWAVLPYWEHKAKLLRPNPTPPSSPYLENLCELVGNLVLEENGNSED